MSRKSTVTSRAGLSESRGFGVLLDGAADGLGNEAIEAVLDALEEHDAVERLGELAVARFEGGVALGQAARHQVEALGHRADLVGRSHRLPRIEVAVAQAGHRGLERLEGAGHGARDHPGEPRPAHDGRERDEADDGDETSEHGMRPQVQVGDAREGGQRHGAQGERADGEPEAEKTM